MKVVINKCFGGFGLSEKAYEQLIAWGVPVRKYVEEQRDPNTGLFLHETNNDVEVIFDRELTPAEENTFAALYHQYKGKSSMSRRYWDTWTRENRTHPLVVRVVEELGSKEASSDVAELAVVEIPDGIEWEISEYDGLEHIAEKHRVWD